MRSYLLLFAAIALLIVTSSGCGSGSRSVNAISTPQVESVQSIDSGLPGLPGDAVTTRRVKAGTPYQFAEADVYDSNLASITGSSLALQEAGLSWAIFGADGGGEIPTQLSLSGEYGGLYIGVSNYSKGTWQWLGGPYNGTSAQDITLPSGQWCNSAGSFYFALICPDGASADISISATLEDLPAWSILVWVAGDNNLAPDAVDDLNEMEAVGSTAEVQVLAGYDINPDYLDGPVAGTNEVHFIKVVADSDPNVINTAGDSANLSFPRSGYNSADPDNLEVFLDWAQANFPAQHTMLVLWNHGDGWLPGSDGKSTSAILSDDTDGPWDMTDNTVVAAALSGRNFDILGFDACNMGQLEALYAFRGTADYYIASQALEPNAGWDYTYLLQNVSVISNQGNVCSAVVNGYEAFYNANPEEACLAALHGDNMELLYTELGNLAAEVTAKAATEGSLVREAIGTAYHPDDGDGSGDLRQFVNTYRGLTSDSEIDFILSSIDSIAAAATIRNGQYQMPDCNGMGVWLPNTEDFSDTNRLNYDALAFDDATGWLAMLEATGVPSGFSQPPLLEWEPGYKVVATFSDPGYQVNPAITDPDENYGTPEAPDGLAGSIQFSQDSSASGIGEESAQLLPGAPSGDFFLDLVTGETSAISVDVQLLDGSDGLVYDFGTVNLGGGVESVFLGALFYNDGSVGETAWEPGDYLKLTWADTNADFDLYLEAPNGGYGYPYDHFGLDNIILFSGDSADTGFNWESAELLSAAPAGIYPIWAEFYDYMGTEPAEVTVQVELYGPDNNVKHAFDDVVFPGDGFWWGQRELCAVLIR